MTAPNRPEWVRITDPGGACYVTVGRVYRVLGWSADHTRPVIRDYEGHPWTLDVAGGVGSWLFPAWEPCEDPAALKAANGEETS